MVAGAWFTSLAVAASPAGLPPEPVPETAHSGTIKALNAEARRIAPDRQITVLDADAMMIVHAREGTLMRFQLKEKFPSMDSDASEYVRGGFGYNHVYNSIKWDPRAVRVKNADMAGHCLVVPQTADISSKTLAQKYVGLQSTQHVKIDFEKDAQFLRATYHEIWHCSDDVYLPRYNAAREAARIDWARTAWHLHQSEFYAEVAAVLTMHAKGYNDISWQQADLRSYRTLADGPFFVREFFPQQIDYYSGAIYHLGPGLDAVTAHVREAGGDAVRAYTPADIRRIATEITEKHSLSQTDFAALVRYFAEGDKYLKRLSQGATAQDRRSHDIIAAMVARGRETAGSLVTETGKAYRSPEGDYVAADDYLAAMDKALVDAVQQDIRSRIRALPEGVRTEAALVSMLDDYRKDLAAAKTVDEITGAETRLTIVRALALSGGFSHDLGNPHLLRQETPAPAAAASRPTP